MKKFILISIFFFNVAQGMEYKQRNLFEAFKQKCGQLSVFDGEKVCADKIDTNAAEVCAAIQNLSTLARELPPEIYEKSLIHLVEAQESNQPEEFQKLVHQLAHMALLRHRGQQQPNYIQPLIFEAVRICTQQSRLEHLNLQRENKQLREETTDRVSLGVAFMTGFITAKITPIFY